MDRPMNTMMEPPSPGGYHGTPLGHWATIAIVFFSGPILWAIGNGVEWAVYNPAEGYRYTEILHPLSQDRIARYWPWAVRVVLGVNILLAVATFILWRQEGAARGGEPHDREVLSIEDWLIKMIGTIATTTLLVFFWVSAAAVGYVVLKHLF